MIKGENKKSEIHKLCPDWSCETVVSVVTALVWGKEGEQGSLTVLNYNTHTSSSYCFVDLSLSLLAFFFYFFEDLSSTTKLANFSHSGRAAPLHLSVHLMPRNQTHHPPAAHRGLHSSLAVNLSENPGRPSHHHYPDFAPILCIHSSAGTVMNRWQTARVLGGEEGKRDCRWWRKKKLDSQGLDGNKC